MNAQVDMKTKKFRMSPASCLSTRPRSMTWRHSPFFHVFSLHQGQSFTVNQYSFHFRSLKNQLEP